MGQQLWVCAEVNQMLAAEPADYHVAPGGVSGAAIDPFHVGDRDRPAGIKPLENLLALAPREPERLRVKRLGRGTACRTAPWQAIAVVGNDLRGFAEELQPRRQALGTSSRIRAG